MHLPSAHTVLAARAVVIAGVIGLGAVLTACGNSSTDDSDASETSQSVEPNDAAAALSVTDPWIKATAGEDDATMTAAFGTLVNDSDTDITVVAASSDVAGMVELHEVVTDGSGGSVMQPKEGGLTIPAGGTHELVAGGDHIMLMGLSEELTPGDEVTITLELSDGSSLDVQALVKPFTGADEDYAGGEDHSGDHSEHDDDGHDHGSHGTDEDQ